MSHPAITLEVLPAGFGDCLLVSCPVGRSTWRMLVDTGPDETYPALRRRLLHIPTAAAGKRHIDLQQALLPAPERGGRGPGHRRRQQAHALVFLATRRHPTGLLALPALSLAGLPGQRSQVCLAAWLGPIDCHPGSWCWWN